MSQNIRTAHLEIENTFLEQNTFNKKTRFIEGVDAPFEVSSSTVVQRLNADMVDGIEGTTITDGINNLQTQINNLDIEGKVDDKVGDLNSLIVSEKSTAVAAINELQYQINALDPEGGSGVDKVGDLTNLTTTDKTNVVNAVNEIDGKNYTYGDPVSEFENFDPINAQFLGGNAPEYYASQLSLTNGLNTRVAKTSIINDLTTGGITNVLSAQQGVALNSAIGQKADTVDTITVKGSVSVPSNNFNDVTENGTYLALPQNFSANFPSIGWGTLLVYQGGTGAVVQEFTSVNGVDIYRRHYDGGAWSSWIRILTSGNVTVSTVAPSVALPEGYIHNVY